MVVVRLLIGCVAPSGALPGAGWEAGGHLPGEGGADPSRRGPDLPLQPPGENLPEEVHPPAALDTCSR